MGHSELEIERSPESVFFGHLDEGRLAYQVSVGTGKAVFFPRVAAPGTGARDLEWRIASGRGTVYATTVVHPRDGAPYNVALIDCDEGFRLMSRVEGIGPDEVAIGHRVAIRIGPVGTEPRYVFEPVGSDR